MRNDYSLITEIPGNMISKEELRMIYCRYNTASKYVSGKKILEVGCGPGLGLKYLLEKGAQMIVAGDITETNIRYAKESIQDQPKIKIMLLDAQQLPFKQNTFDVILLYEVIFYLIKPDVFLSECKRTLRKNGIVIICLPNKLAPGFRPSQFSTEYYNSRQLYDLFYTYFNVVNVYGAFPVRGSIIKQQFISFVRLIAAKLFNITIIGKKLKERLKIHIFRRNIILSHNIDDNTSTKERLEPINNNELNNRYRILYTIARQ